MERLEADKCLNSGYLTAADDDDSWKSRKVSNSLQLKYGTTL